MASRCSNMDTLLDRALEPILLPRFPGPRNSTSRRAPGHYSNNRNDYALVSQSLAIKLHNSDLKVDKYPAKAHARRVAEKLKVSDGTIAIASNPQQLYPNSDQAVPFRQDRDFYYLTGSNEPGQYVTYDIGKDSLKLWLPSIDESRVVWTGRGSTIEEALEKYDIDEAEYLSDVTTHDPTLSPRRNITEWLEKRHRATINVACEGSEGRMTAWADATKGYLPLFFLHYTSGALWKWGLDVPNSPQRPWLEPKNSLQFALNACRVIKDEHEIRLIRTANEITTKAHIAALKGLHSFTTEAQVDAAYTATCIANNAKEQAYAPIVGSGPNASVLHYDANNEAFGDRQVCVMDAGCEVHCYASDVTRSFPLNKKNPGRWLSKEAKEIYELVERVQEACIEALGPGRDFIQIVLLARRLTVEGLMKLGVLKGDFEEIWKAGTVLGFFPHGLGHHVGLEVHDVSPIPHPPLPDAVTDFLHPMSLLKFQLSKPFEAPRSLPMSRLEPGMVVTIEPGCYFNHFLLERFFLNHPVHSKFIDRDVLERYWQVGGVRIEDDILITRDGYENLTTTPKGDKMLEVIRDGAKKQSSALKLS